MKLEFNGETETVTVAVENIIKCGDVPDSFSVLAGEFAETAGH